METSRELIESNLKALAIYHANNDCMTVEQCADFLKKSKQTILSYIHKGEIKAKMIGCTWSIPKLQFMDNIIENWK